MEEKNVVVDRILFARCFISYKRMEDNDVMMDMTFGKSTDGEQSESRNFIVLKLGVFSLVVFGVGFFMSILFTRYPKDAY